ncbi:hypothetical protein JCM8097_003453 [Rhodosporidiobolus ruineniae]
MKLVVKASLGHAHPRRVSFPAASEVEYDNLINKLAQAFSLKPSSFRLAWRDDDNDLIALDSTADLRECLDFYLSESPPASASSAYSGTSSASASSWLFSGSSSGSGTTGSAAPAAVTIKLDLLVEYDGPALSDGGSSIYGGGGGGAGSDYGVDEDDPLGLHQSRSRRPSLSSERSGTSSRRTVSTASQSQSGASSSWLRQQFWPSNSTSSGALESESEESDDDWDRQTVSSVSQVYDGARARGRRRRGSGRGRGGGGRREWEDDRWEARHPPPEHPYHPPYPPSHPLAQSHHHTHPHPPPHPHPHHPPPPPPPTHPYPPYPFHAPPFPSFPLPPFFSHPSFPFSPLAFPHFGAPTPPASLLPLLTGQSLAPSDSVSRRAYNPAAAPARETALSPSPAPAPPPEPSSDTPSDLPSLTSASTLSSSSLPSLSTRSPAPSTSSSSSSSGGSSTNSGSAPLTQDLAAAQASGLLAGSVTSDDNHAHEGGEEDETGSSYTVSGAEGSDLPETDAAEEKGRKENEAEAEEAGSEWSWAESPAGKQEQKRCVGCGEAFGEAKARFVCAVCEGWVVCVECEAASPPSLDSHDPTHILLKLPAASSASLAAARSRAAALQTLSASSTPSTLSLNTLSTSNSSDSRSPSPAGSTSASRAGSASNLSQLEEAYEAYWRNWWEWLASLPQPPPPPSHPYPPADMFYPPAPAPPPHYPHVSPAFSAYAASYYPPPAAIPPPPPPPQHLVPTPPPPPPPPTLAASPFLFRNHGVPCSACGELIPGPSFSPSSSSSSRSTRTARLSPFSSSTSLSSAGSFPSDAPLELGTRWLCANCPTVPSFDLCPSCESRSEEVHDPSHAFLRLTYPVGGRGRRGLPSVRALVPLLYKEGAKGGGEEGEEEGEGMGEGDLMDLRSERGGRKSADSRRSGGSGSSGGRTSRGGGAGGEEEVVHPNVICDGCSQPIRGAWMRCCHCPHSYDLCTPCLALNAYSSTPHPAHHVFLKLKRAVDLPLLREITRLRTRRPRGLIEFDLYV